MKKQELDTLIDLIYAAAADSSLWPDLISNLDEFSERETLISDDIVDTQSHVAELVKHLKRSIQISEKILTLQEENRTFRDLLDSFSYGVCLVSSGGEIIFKNKSFNTILNDFGDFADLLALEYDLLQPMLLTSKNGFRELNTKDECAVARVGVDDGSILVTRILTTDLPLPSTVSSILITYDLRNSSFLDAFMAKINLTKKQKELLIAQVQESNLKSAAAKTKISYNSARVYMGKILEKADKTNQIDLLVGILTNPMNLISNQAIKTDRQSGFRKFHYFKGRRMEYFDVGNPNGFPVIFFGSFTGVTIDVLGYPDECKRYLGIWDIRLIIPCRPGCFRSEYFEHNGLSDLAIEVGDLVEALDLPEISILAVGFSSGLALAVARSCSVPINKVILSSPTYPDYAGASKEVDPFSQVIFSVGSRSQLLFRVMVRFLIRSAIFNTESFLDRYMSKSKSQSDVDILKIPIVRTRTRELLSERTVNGTEGMVQEFYLDRYGWDFKVEKIRCMIEVYHGVEDRLASMEAAKKLSQMLQKCEFSSLEGSGNFHHIRNWPWLLARAAGKNISPGSVKYSFPGEGQTVNDRSNS